MLDVEILQGKPLIFIFIFIVNGNRYTTDDKHPKILRLSHWEQKFSFLRLMKQTIIFGKLFPEGLWDGFVNILGQEQP